MEQTNTWGGARPGAGRKPKAMRYAPVFNAVEAYFASELMNIAVEMVKRAKDNNDNIAKYIMNRMFGAPARLEDSPATDRMLPYNDANLENAVRHLIKHCQNNSAIDQVVKEILEDTVCTVPPVSDTVTPVASSPAPTAENPAIAALNPVTANVTNNLCLPGEEKRVNPYQMKSFAQLCAEYNMDPRTVDIVKLRDAIRDRHTTTKQNSHT